MKTIQEYLSGSHDEELRALVAEARGWTFAEDRTSPYPSGPERKFGYWKRPDSVTHYIPSPPSFPTSRDACKELLADLTEDQQEEFSKYLASFVCGATKLGQVSSWQDLEAREAFAFLRATARQICVIYLIVKGIIK